MAKKKDKNKKKTLKINVIDGAYNQQSSRIKSEGVSKEIFAQTKIDDAIRENGQVDIIRAFSDLFKFNTLSADDLTIDKKMSIGYRTAHGKIPRLYQLEPLEGVDNDTLNKMMRYTCPHRIIVGEGAKKYVKHMAYPIAESDPAYDVYKQSMIPSGWKLARCAMCNKIELIKDPDVSDTDRANISDIMMQASLAVETVKSLYSAAIHNEIETIGKEPAETKLQILEQLKLLREFSGEFAYNIANIAHDLDKGTSIEDKKNKDDDIASSYGVNVDDIFD